MREMLVSAAELREDLKTEQRRAARLEEQLRLAHTEIRALKTARDAALRIAAWSGSSRVDGSVRHEH